MALRLRLSRGGSKKRPFYRIVVAEKSAPRDGRYIERLGVYNPLLPKDHEDRVKLQSERIKHWLGVGALPSDRVARFLGEAKIIPMPEQRNNPQKAKPKAKAQERLAEKEEKANAPAEAPAEQAEAPVEASAEAAEAAPADAAAPAEEKPAEAAAEEKPAEAAAEEEKKAE